jgi:hypothetical protein
VHLGDNYGNALDATAVGVQDLRSTGKGLRQGTYDIGEVADRLFGLVRIGD